MRDLDQAYEQCDGAKVGVSWHHLAGVLEESFSSSRVLVRKGKRVRTQYHGASSYGRG